MPKSSIYDDGLFSCGSLPGKRLRCWVILRARIPLGLMVAQALYNSNNTIVNFVGVSEETVAGYGLAMDTLDEDSVVYGVVPFTTDPTILTSIRDRIQLLSGPTRMNWKAGWFAYDFPTVTVSPPTTLVGNGTGSTVGVAGVDLGGVSVGDTVVAGRLSAKVTGVNVLSATITLNKTVPSGIMPVPRISRVPTTAEKVALARRPAPTTITAFVWWSRLVRRRPLPTELVSNAYVAAACAGYRSVPPPHQPLTRATVAGFVLSSMGGLSATKLG